MNNALLNFKPDLLSDGHVVPTPKPIVPTAIDLQENPADPRLTPFLSAHQCLAFSAVVWRQVGSMLVIAVADNASIPKIRTLAELAEHRVTFVSASLHDIHRSIARSHHYSLSIKADKRCPSDQSCRGWAQTTSNTLAPALILAALVVLSWVFPTAMLILVLGWILLFLGAMTVLRLLAVFARLRAGFQHADTSADNVTPLGKLPKVSILVPLHRENHVLPKLISRLQSTDYPKHLLEVCLILEANDTITKTAASSIELPSWFRIIEVPAAALQTKPRAMNYALEFCTGSIIGVYDAEDAPEADQIRRVVNKFRRSGANLACIQGYLDFYNTTQNWLSRCFAIEYSVWFRVLLQGLERLGLPFPLGGTTVFFRREALDSVGAWDAHNVTEDADLGIRLARHGYRCTFLATTTFEEANCHTLPWIKQRSRWLKGYAMTWYTHMRAPLSLWRDLGPKGFLGFQALFLGTLTTFALAPLLWLLWLLDVGPADAYLPNLPPVFWSILIGALVATELVQLLIGIFAVSNRAHRRLIIFVPTMVLYWPLGTIAIYKALYELIAAPFYWDKTEHGKPPT